MGTPLLNPAWFPGYIYPESKNLPVVVDSPAADLQEPQTKLPQNLRMGLTPLYQQLGKWVDYYTGDHSLSDRLRANRRKETIPDEHIVLFPQFGNLSQWPPTFFVLGETDTVVPLYVTKNLTGLLEEAGVEITVRVAPGEDHLFDVLPHAEEVYGKMLDEAAAFLVAQLKK